MWQTHLSRIGYDILHHNIVYFLPYSKFSPSLFVSIQSAGNYEVFTDTFILDENDVLLLLDFVLFCVFGKYST